MKVNEFLAHITGSKNSLAGVLTQLEALYQKRATLRATPPDRDSLVAWALRGVERAEAQFSEHLLGWYLSPQHVKGVPGEWFDNDVGVGWLEVQPACPGVRVSSADTTADSPALFSAALHALLAPQLKEILPKLIDRTFQFQANAMPSTERMKKLAAVEKEIAALEAQRESLIGELEETKRQVDSALGQ